MVQVYKAEDLHNKGSYVAMKRIRLDTEDEGIPCTTLREIAVLRRLHHPNIVELVDVVHQQERAQEQGTVNGRIYLIFEFVDEDLKKQMDRCARAPGGGGLDFDLVRSYTFQMLQGIEFCHNRGVMHRDMKPQNLLVSHQGQLKIADFGLARAFVPPVRPFTHEVVTLWYRAPEILLGEKTYSLPVDLWSAGVILCEMLNNGIPFFPGDSEIDELFKIFRVLGSPCKGNWPEGMQLPDYNDSWPMWPALDLGQKVPRARCENAACLELLENLLVLDPREVQVQAIGVQFDHTRVLDTLGRNVETVARVGIHNSLNVAVPEVLAHRQLQTLGVLLIPAGDLLRLRAYLARTHQLVEPKTPHREAHIVLLHLNGLVNLQIQHELLKLRHFVVKGYQIHVDVQGEVVPHRR